MISIFHGCNVLAAGQRQASAALRQPAPAPCQRQRRLGVARVAAASSEAGLTRLSSDEMEALAAQISRKEEDLKMLFQPHKPQPKASVVAGLRREISQLRAQLQGQLGIGVAAPAAAKAAVGAAFPTATISAVDTAVTTGSISALSRSLNALKLVEAQLATAKSGQGPTVSLMELSAKEQQELLRLQEENTTLKSELDYVLARQAQLQLLWDKHMGTSSAASTVVANGAAPAAVPSNGAAPAAVPADGTAPAAVPAAPASNVVSTASSVNGTAPAADGAVPGTSLWAAQAMAAATATANAS